MFILFSTLGMLFEANRLSLSPGISRHNSILWAIFILPHPMFSLSPPLFIVLLTFMVSEPFHCEKQRVKVLEAVQGILKQWLTMESLLSIFLHSTEKGKRAISWDIALLPSFLYTTPKTAVQRKIFSWKPQMSWNSRSQWKYRLIADWAG